MKGRTCLKIEIVNKGQKDLQALILPHTSNLLPRTFFIPGVTNPVLCHKYIHIKAIKIKHSCIIADATIITINS